MRRETAAASGASRSETRAASMAVSPPPTTTTFLPRSTSSPEFDLVQELGAGEDAGALLARDAHGLALVGADADEDRVVLLAQVARA